MSRGGPAYEWVGDWSARRASLSPDRMATVDDAPGSRYSYADLDRWASRTARLLAAHGVESGERVALVSRTRIEPFDLFFATGKTGGVLAPLFSVVLDPGTSSVSSGRARATPGPPA